MTLLDKTIAQIREAYASGETHSEIEKKVKDVVVNYGLDCGTYRYAYEEAYDYYLSQKNG